MASSASSRSVLGDEGLQVSPDVAERLSSVAYAHQLASVAASRPVSVGELRSAIARRVLPVLGDSTFNPVSGLGTAKDPSIWLRDTFPVQMSPYELSQFYGEGGLGRQILDKKSYTLTNAGLVFEQDDFWTYERLKPLYAAVQETSFLASLGDALRDALLYGGSIIYPQYSGDTYYTYRADFQDSRPSCILRWVVVDRWNVVFVPHFSVTADDFMNPESVYIPQSSLEVHSSRISFIKANQVPYLLALSYMGWAPSDVLSWISPYLGYKITIQSIPIMAQQMSLLLYRLPLDALNATIGPDNVRKLMQLNEEKMMEWSAVSPKAVNMVGEVEVVNRTYAGFEDFVGAMKSALSAQCGVPEPLLWYTPNKGFSDNATTAILKQSDVLKTIQQHFLHDLKPCFKALVLSAYGAGSEEAARWASLKMRFGASEQPTAAERADTGERFAASFAELLNAGVGAKDAVSLLKRFYAVMDEPIELKEPIERPKPAAAGEAAPAKQVNRGRRHGRKA